MNTLDVQPYSFPQDGKGGEGGDWIPPPKGLLRLYFYTYIYTFRKHFQLWRYFGESPLNSFEPLKQLGGKRRVGEGVIESPSKVFRSKKVVYIQ